MADKQNIDEMFHRLTRDIVVRVHRPSPLSLARRAGRHRSRQISASVAAVVAGVVLGGTTLILGFSAADDQTPDTAAGSDVTARAPVEPTTSARCEKADGSNDEVASGARLAWSSSFICDEAPPEGTYELTVRVTNEAGSRGALALDTIEVTRATPRPGGTAPTVSGEATRLPLVLERGNAGSFVVSGTYELVTTDEGKKANLHIRVIGHVIETGDPFDLDVIAHLRAPGAVEDDSDRVAPQEPRDRTGTSREANPHRNPPTELNRYAQRLGSWARCIARHMPSVDWRGTLFDPMAECGPRPRPPG